MEPVKRKNRPAFHNGPIVSVKSIKDTNNTIDEEPFKDYPAYDDVDITEPLSDTYNEDGNMAFTDDQAPSVEDIEEAEVEADRMTDEEIKVKALKQAIDICKLMSEVTTLDVIKVAAKVAAYIKG